MLEISGKTCADIAFEQDVSLVTVRRWAKAAGFKLGWGGGRMSYFTPDEVAKITAMRGGSKKR